MVSPKTLRNERIERNMGLVHACAGRFRGRGVEYEDLFQAGCVGLCKAADGFDESKGYAFSTYAVPTILGEIRRLFRDGGAVKVGRSTKEQSRRLLQLQETMEAETGRTPLLSELSQRAGIDAAQAAFLLGAAMPVLSLTPAEDASAPQTDVPVPPPDECVDDRVSLDDALRTLDDTERRIVQLRFYRGMTQSAVAQEVGVSQVQISRREKAILLKLRRQFTE